MVANRSAHRLFLAIEEFRKLDQTMPIQMMATFLYIAQNSGRTMQETANDLGLSQASVSRNVAALTDWHSAKKEGHGLLKAVADPMEMRRKIVTLTDKGQRALKRLNGIMEQ